jgi:hypothetical protein
MGVKRREDKLRCVTYEYVGTDKDFDAFLKLLIHDYLAVDHPGAATEETLEKTESSVA